MRITGLVIASLLPRPPRYPPNYMRAHGTGPPSPPPPGAAKRRLSARTASATRRPTTTTWWHTCRGRGETPWTRGRRLGKGAPDALEGADDVACTAAVLDAAEALLCVDGAHVYVTGHSQGGGFVGAQLACDAATSERLAAFAPVSGAFYNASLDRSSRCDPPHLENACEATHTRTENRSITPMLELHGGADDVIDFHGGFRKGACLPAIRRWAKDWARRNRLDLRDDVVRVGGRGMVSSTCMATAW
ncbi:hypothetical protein DL771_001791 [Monosporascus sp. 5C6A]|nr:hypothetical protein DL771_001791 [Monosporascus sp. 5C6A]